MSRSKYIVFEGYDGSGKTTLINTLVSHLSSRINNNIIKIKDVPLAPKWISHEDLELIISGKLPTKLAIQIRAHRHIMQFEYSVMPYVKAGIHVFGDRGPASMMWRLSQFGDSFYFPKLQSMLSNIDYHFLLSCSGETCYERITKYRPLNRLETNYNKISSVDSQKSVFLKQHTAYYNFVSGILTSIPHRVLDSSLDPDELMQSALETLSLEIFTPLLTRNIKSTLRNFDKQNSIANLALPSIDQFEKSKSSIPRFFNRPLEDIVKDFLAYKEKPGLELEGWFADLISSGRNDIESLCFEIVEEMPSMIRVLAKVVNKNGYILSPRLLSKILIDDTARTYLVCNLGDDALQLPSFEEIHDSLLHSTNDRVLANCLTLYIKGCEQSHDEILKTGALVFDKNRAIARSAVQAWLACGYIELLPKSLTSHPSAEIRYLLALHDFDQTRHLSINVTPINNVFGTDEHFTLDQLQSLKKLKEMQMFLQRIKYYIQLPQTYDLQDNIQVFSVTENTWQQSSLSIVSVLELPGAKVIAGNIPQLIAQLDLDTS